LVGSSLSSGRLLIHFIYEMSNLPELSELPTNIKVHLRYACYEHIASTYTLCLELEKAVQSRIDANEVVGRDMIYCRILGYLLLHPPTDRAAKTVQFDISSCKGDQAMLNVGQMYYDHFIRACTLYVRSYEYPFHVFIFSVRSNKGRTPNPTNHASRPSFDTIADMISDCMEEAPQGHASAKKRVSYFYYYYYY
jgi:hypothetical protein